VNDMSSRIETAGVRVVVRPSWWAERSRPGEGVFAFSYAVEITNLRDEPVRLTRRHWVIADAAGREEIVDGEGVIGQTPLLAPGKSFSYTSWAMLRTPYGSMRGHYTMERPDGETFEATIAEFALVQPNALN